MTDRIAMEPYFGQPTTVRRTGWGASMPSKGYARHTPERIVIHHSWSPRAEDFDGAATIRAIQKYHMGKGWSDIGYHFLISPDGVIYEGRPCDVVGAHCGNRPYGNQKRVFGNRGSIGICCIGCYDQGEERPSEKMLMALAQLTVWLQRLWGIHPMNLYGHRECMSPPLDKTCPGELLYCRVIGRNRWRDIIESKKAEDNPKP